MLLIVEVWGGVVQHIYRSNDKLPFDVVVIKVRDYDNVTETEEYSEETYTFEA